MKSAAFIFPTDGLGGAEKILRLLATYAADKCDFDKVYCFVMSRGRSGSLAELEGRPNVAVIYGAASSEIKSIPALYRFFSKRPYDLVVSSHTHVNAAVSFARKLGILKCAIIVARESTMIFERSFHPLKKLVLRGLYFFYGAQDRIICQTEAMRRSLNTYTSNAYEGRVEVIPNPISLSELAAYKSERCPVHIPNGSPNLIWCGRLEKVKNPLLAIDVLSLLRKEGGLSAELLIIGRGQLATDIQSYARNLGVADALHMVGYQKNPITVFHAVRDGVGLLTSEKEGFPNVVLEQLSAGVRRVVTTPCAGDLDNIPGVTVSKGMSAREVADAVIQSLQVESPVAAVVEHLRSRDINVYAPRAIGCPPSRILEK